MRATFGPRAMAVPTSALTVGGAIGSTLGLGATGFADPLHAVARPRAALPTTNLRHASRFTALQYDPGDTNTGRGILQFTCLSPSAHTTLPRPLPAELGSDTTQRKGAYDERGHWPPTQRSGAGVAVAAAASVR